MTQGFITPTNACLACGLVVDRATNVAGTGQPKPGDVTICLRCGHLMAFDQNLNFRALNAAEMRDVAGDARILRAQSLREKVMSRRQ